MLLKYCLWVNQKNEVNIKHFATQRTGKANYLLFIPNFCESFAIDAHSRRRMFGARAANHNTQQKCSIRRYQLSKKSTFFLNLFIYSRTTLAKADYRSIIANTSYVMWDIPCEWFEGMVYVTISTPVPKANITQACLSIWADIQHSQIKHIKNMFLISMPCGTDRFRLFISNFIDYAHTAFIVLQDLHGEAIHYRTLFNEAYRSYKSIFNSFCGTTWRKLTIFMQM